MSSRRAWRWKVADPSVTEALGLRYEPGNWGDVLKAIWAREVLESLPRSPGTRRILDPFCGRPAYPVLPAAAERLERLEGAGLLAGWGQVLDAETFPSTTGLLQRLAAERGSVLEATVYDVDPEARQAWTGRPHVRLLDARDGYEALTGPEARESDIVLVDPYDFFDEWPRARGIVVELARERAVLVYIYNKAARGGGYLRNYRALRRAFADSLQASAKGLAGLLGRVPSDAILPRAHHEVVLLGPTALVASLRETLSTRTRELAATIHGDGAVEEI